MKKITKICLPIAAAAMVGGGMVPLISCKTDTGQYDNVKLSYDSKAIKIISVDKVFGEDLVVKYDEINPNYNYSKPTVKVAGEDAPFAWDEDLKTIAIDRDLLTTNDISVEIDFNTTGKNYVAENVNVEGAHCRRGAVSGSFGEDMVVSIGIDQDGYVIDKCNVTVGDVRVEGDLEMSDGHKVTIPAHYFSKYNETVSINVTITGREIKVESIEEEDSHFTLSVRQHKWGEDIIAYAETTASYQFTGEYEVHIGSATGPTVEAQNIDNEITIPWANLQGKITYTDHIFIKVYTLGRPFEYVVNDGEIVRGLAYTIEQNEWNKDFKLNYTITPGYEVPPCGINVHYVSREIEAPLEFEWDGDVHQGTIVIHKENLLDHRWELHIDIAVTGTIIPVKFHSETGLEWKIIKNTWGEDVLVEVHVDDNYERTSAPITAEVTNPNTGYYRKYIVAETEILKADFVWFEAAEAGSEVTFDVPVQGKTLTNVKCYPEETPESGIIYDEIIKRFGEPVTIRYHLDRNHQLSGQPTATVNGEEVTVLGTEGNHFISAEVVTSYTDAIVFNFPVVGKHYVEPTVIEYPGLENVEVDWDVEYGQDIEVSFDINENYELDQTKKVTATIDGVVHEFTPVDNQFTILASMIPNFDSEITIDIPVKGRALEVIVVADEDAISYNRQETFMYGDKVQLTDFNVSDNYELLSATYQIGDRLPKPVVFEEEGTIATVDPADIIDADEVITFEFETEGKQLNPKFSGTDGVVYTLEQATYGKDIIINYKVRHGYERKGALVATYESVPLTVKEEISSEDVWTATIEFDKTIITDYSKDIDIQFQVDPLDYENVTINGFDSVEGPLTAHVIAKTYGSDVKIEYKINPNYWIKGDVTGKDKVFVYYGDAPVGRQIDGDPYDGNATITIRSALIPDYQVHVNAIIDVEGKPLTNFNVETEDGITAIVPEAKFGEDIIIPFTVDITKFTKGDFEIDIPYEEDYDPSTGEGTITIRKEKIENFEQNIKVTMKSIASGVTVEYEEYPGLITPVKPEYADLERGVRLTFDVEDYYHEISDDITAQIMQIGGTWGPEFKPTRSETDYRTISVDAKRFEDNQPRIKFNIPVVGDSLNNIHVHEGKDQPETGGLNYEITQNEYNKDILIKYGFTDDYELNGELSDIKYSIGTGPLQPVKSATDELITIAASETITPDTQVDVYIPTIGKTLSNLLINTDQATGFSILSKADRFNDNLVLNYQLNANYEFDGDVIAKVREGEQLREVKGIISEESHTITFNKDALDLHTHADRVLIIVKTKPKAYTNITVNAGIGVHYSIPTDTLFGNDVKINYYLDAGYEVDEAGVTAKVDDIPVNVIDVPPTPEAQGEATITFEEMEGKVEDLKFNSNIVFNIPVKGQSFTNVHINSNDGFRGITLTEMTAVFGQDLVAKYIVNSSYEAKLEEAYFQVGPTGTHVGITAEDGTITIPWETLQEQLVGYEDPTSAEIIISIPTEGKQMTSIEVYGGVTCDTSGAKFDADGGITLTYEFKEGRVRSTDDITLSVQGKDVTTAPETWTVDEDTNTIQISREMFKAHGETAPIIKTFEDVIIINVPTEGVSFEVAWAEGCQIEATTLPEWDWEEDYHVAYSVLDNYLRDDAQDVTVYIDGVAATGVGEIIETVQEDKKSGDITIPWTLIYPDVSAEGEHSITINVPTKGDEYKDTTVTDNQPDPIEVVSGSFSKKEYGKTVVASCEITDENWELEDTDPDKLADNFSATIGGVVVDLDVSENAGKYEMTIAHEDIEATGRGVADAIRIVVNVKAKDWGGNITWAENEDVTSIEVDGSPKYYDDITVTITLEAGCEFDLEDKEVTAEVVGGTAGSITATREGETNKFTLSKSDLAEKGFKHDSDLKFTVPTKHSELNIATPVYDPNAVTIVGAIAGTYGDPLSFKFKVDSNYTLDDDGVTAAGGGTTATAVVTGPDSEGNYTAAFTKEQIIGALSAPDAALTITIPTEAKAWEGTAIQNEESKNDDVESLSRDSTEFKFNDDITGTLKLKTGCSLAGSEHDVIAQVDGAGTMLDVNVEGERGEITWSLTKEALADAGFGYLSNLVFIIKTKHDSLHIEKGSIDTGVSVTGDITGTYGDPIIFDYTVTNTNYEVTEIKAATATKSFSSPTVQQKSTNVFTVTFDWDDIEGILESPTDTITISIETQGKQYTRVSAAAAEGQEESVIFEPIESKHYGEDIVIEFTIDGTGMQLSRTSTITVGEGSEEQTFYLSDCAWIGMTTDESGKTTLTIKFSEIPSYVNLNFDTLVKITIVLEAVVPPGP